MAKVLTARFVETVKRKPERRAYADGLVRGLELRVAPAGSKSWALRYRVGRRSRRWTLGSYPALSLADARDRALDAIRALASGRDPALKKQERREADTVDDLVRCYLTQHARPHKKSWKDDRRMLEREVLPAWRHRLATDVRRRDVRELLDAVAGRPAPIAANRLRALLHTLFAFAVAREIVEVNPVTAVPKSAPERSRDRVLDAGELRAFWAALDGETPAMAAFFRLRLLTAQRGGEVQAMRWADVDLEAGWWTIAAADSKNRLAHRVPLTTPAVRLLAGLLAEARAGAAFVVEGARGKRQRAAAAARLGLVDFRGHDLRRTAASLVAGAGVGRVVIGKVLNHAERGVTAVYDRHSYDAEKRVALETWARTLQAILDDRPAGAVVPFAR